MDFFNKNKIFLSLRFADQIIVFTTNVVFALLYFLFINDWEKNFILFFVADLFVLIIAQVK